MFINQWLNIKMNKKFSSFKELGEFYRSNVEPTFSIPLGYWTIDTDVIYWTPNYDLKLTPKEQREHNEKNGYNCDVIQRSDFKSQIYGA